MAALSEAVQNQLAPAIDLDGRPLHPALAAIIARATQKEPAARYPDVRAMTDDLRRFIRDEPVSVYEEGVARQSRARGRAKAGLGDGDSFAVRLFDQRGDRRSPSCAMLDGPRGRRASWRTRGAC